MKVCLQPRLFIHFVWFRMMFLPWITVFPIWQEHWHYALCLRYQRFAASRFLVSARLGSFTKHEMDKASMMYCRKREQDREGDGQRETERGKRQRRGLKNEKMWWGSSVSGRQVQPLPPESCCLSWDARAWWSQENTSVGMMDFKYHWRGQIGTVCFYNLCILEMAD